MSTENTKMDIAPWYRQRWPWIIISIPATSVVLGLSLLYVAITTWDGLVVDDYYRQGRAIDQTMARSVYAAELGLAADLQFRTDHITVRLSANEGVALPPRVLVTIAHPTRSGRDQSVALDGSDGEFSGALSPLSTGRWLVQIEDGERTWRLRRAIYLPDDARVRVLPYGS